MEKQTSAWLFSVINKGVNNDIWCETKMHRALVLFWRDYTRLISKILFFLVAITLIVQKQTQFRIDLSSNFTNSLHVWETDQIQKRSKAFQFQWAIKQPFPTLCALKYHTNVSMFCSERNGCASRRYFPGIWPTQISLFASELLA